MKYQDFDKEEKKIMIDFERGEMERVAGVEKEKKRLVALARAGLKKSRNVNIRLPESVLYKIKARAVESGLPYQTLIASLMHKYASGQLRVEV